MPSRGFKIRIPFLMLGPYPRSVLYWTIGISAAVCALIFGMAAYTKGYETKESLVKAAVGWFIFAVSVGGLTLFLHFMGMP